MLMVDYHLKALELNRDIEIEWTAQRRLGVPYTPVLEIPVKAAGAAPDDALAVFVSELDVAARRP